MARKISVEILGDSRNLERSFQRSAKSAQGFTASIDKSAKRLTGFQRGAIGGFAGAAALSTITQSLTQVVKLAAESQQVLGQTSVALESVGFSWEQYGGQIEEAVKAQSKFGFDDEALLRSFSLFIRTSDSVTEALRRNRIAMDVARARFIDLEAATNLVNKAALGQAGALRRVGIDARKGASGIELLAQLEREFGGAAEAASADAATAMDRLNVQVENLQESIGTLLLPLVTNLATILGNAADLATELGTALGRLGDKARDARDKLPIPKAVSSGWKELVLRLNPATAAYKNAKLAIDLVNRALGEQSEATKQTTHDFSALNQLLEGRALVFPGGVSTPMAAPLTPKQRRQFFDARLARQRDRLQDLSLEKQVAGLKGIADELRAKIALTQDATRRLTLEDELLSVLREQRSVQKQIADEATDAAEKQKRRQEEIAAKIKEANQALKDRAEAIKSAVLDRLQARQTDVLNRRALREAQERLRIARLLGGPAGTRLAREQLQDVGFDIRRAEIERARATLTRGGRFALGNMVTINVHGVTDPNAVAIKVAAVLKRKDRLTSSPKSGPAAGASSGGQ